MLIFNTMNKLLNHSIAVLFVSCGFSYGQGLNVLLEDDFNDGIVDLAKWTMEEPFADSSVLETGGYVELQNRGRITSTIGIDDPYEVRGRFQLSNVERSNIKFVLRSDGVAVPRWSDSQGVAVQFQIRGDAANTNQIAIFNIDSSGTQTGSATLTTPLSLDQWYDFRIVDDGARISLFFNGAITETLGVDTNWSAGNLISIYNREGAAGGSSISAGGIARVDSFSTQELPKPSLDDGLVAYYPFNGNANDESGNGNDLVSVNAVVTPDRRGASGDGSYSFDGESSKLISTGYKGVTGSGARTISLWIKPSDTEGGFFFSYGTPTWEGSDRGKDFRLGLKSSNTGMYLDANWVGVEGDFPQPLVAGEWHHLSLLRFN